ncbi:hypothetical protein SRABI76_02554 [Microbacterium oxydans]|uniref:hypothetical protein n=1 Tax=Microbacterium oxydans TaxID=82380 RepID=UPI001D1CABCF|nr:hypothetical protein [Microbacterium oxydans]CAH0222851.1 hypothetical protein SRABI76_02554 [Microbacterium oxydans]
MRTMQRGTVALAALFSASLVMTACTPTTTSIEESRHTLYSDVAGLAADSEAVVDVVVDSQEIVQEAMPYTLSTVTVIAPLQPTGLAANADAAATVTPEQQIVIRQLGSSAEETVPAPLLEVGGRYLLFVTSTQLPGDAASQFYVTGGSAGLYRTESASEARGSDVSYARVDVESGDSLPLTLRTAELAG